MTERADGPDRRNAPDRRDLSSSRDILRRGDVSGDARKRSRGWTRAMYVALVLGAGVFAVVGVGALLVLYPRASWVLPPCLFHELTGLHCTGCGSTRSAYALLTGDLGGAWVQNPLFLLVLPWLGYGTVRGAVRLLLPGRDLPSANVPGKLYWVFAAAVIAFSIARNLPFVHFLGPLP